MSAAQDYNTISQPSTGVGATTLSLVVKKGEKKQQQELAHLATVLREVETQLVSAKSGATTGHSDVGATEHSSAPSLGSTDEASGPGASGPPSQSLRDMLAKMAGALQLLQVEIAKYASSKSHSESGISQAELTLAQDHLNKANEQLKKLQEAEYKQAHMSFWEKLVEGICGALLAIVAVITCQPELAVMAVVCILGATGALSKATQGLAEFLEKDLHMGKIAAQIVSAVLITAVTIAATGGAGTLAGVGDASAEALEIGTEEGTAAAADGAIDAGINGAEEGGNSFLDRVGTFFKKINLFRKLGARTNLMIFAGMNAASQTNLITTVAGDIAYAACTNKKEKEKMKEEVEQIASVVVAVMTALVSVGSGAAAMEAGSAARGVTGLSRVARALTSSGAQKIFAITNLVLGGGTTAFGIETGQAMKSQGDAEAALAELQGETVINNVSMDMLKDEMNSSNSFISQQEAGIKTSDQVIQNLNNGGAAIAQVLCSSAV